MTRNLNRSINLIESLEHRQLLAADLPSPFRPPVVFDRVDRTMIFGLAISMANSFPSHLVARFGPPALAQNTDAARSVQTSPSRETDSPENAVPAGDAPDAQVATDEAPAVQTFKLIDPSQEDGGVVDAVKAIARAGEPQNLSSRSEPQRTMVLDRDVFVATLPTVAISPFATIDNAITSALATNANASDVVTINTFGSEPHKTSAGRSAEAEEVAVVEDQRGVPPSLPLAIIAPEMTANASLWRDLLASATVVFAVIGNWYLRRTRKSASRTVQKVMIDVPGR